MSTKRNFSFISSFCTQTHIHKQLYIHEIDGQSDVEVNLIAKKYVERGGSLTLTCKHNVEQDKLYKVTWLKSSSKIFEYIKSRDPPYRNFTVAGADIDVRKENKTKKRI